jgi:hypothetical protein
MAVDALFSQRKTLDQICTVPDRIISVYSLEKHIWADSNSDQSRRERTPELQTIDEFQLNPVRPFLNDLFRKMAAPYDPRRKENPIGQGYWVQAEFGSGKSHLLCLVAALALGSADAWDLLRQKEEKAGRGKRESLYQFWEEGLKAKSGGKNKGIFVIAKTLVGEGGGPIAIDGRAGKSLVEYILKAAKEQIQVETGKNLSLYPAELLVDRFLEKDVDRYRHDLKKFLSDPRFFHEKQFEDVDDFLRDMRENKSPEFKRSCGNKLWQFYSDYLQVTPDLAAESEDVLQQMVETILAEGYSGVLLLLDEVSLFMKDREEQQRTEDEKTLVVLSNRLAKVKNLPIWTVCAAQQAIESKLGVKNILATDRLSLVTLLDNEKDYFDIALARVREITDPDAIPNYYLHYQRGFKGISGAGETEFRTFFPFHKPALVVLRQITYALTTQRSAIHFMHQTLKQQIKAKGNELIRLWQLFDETVSYEEDPSGVQSGISSIKTTRENEYKAYKEGEAQINNATRGALKIYRQKALCTLQTLFLYHLARLQTKGLLPEELAYNVLIERKADCTPEENEQHYESIAENLLRETGQVDSETDEAKRPRYRFKPERSLVNPKREWEKARNEAEASEKIQQEAWEHLLALDTWPVRTKQMNIDLSGGVKSQLADIASFVGPWEDRSTARAGDQELEVSWLGRAISGRVGMRNLVKVAAEQENLPRIDSENSDLDFSVMVSTKPIGQEALSKILLRFNDPRLILWTPAERMQEENDMVLSFAAYRKLANQNNGKDTEEAQTILQWVAQQLRTDLAKMLKAMEGSYARGRMDALHHTQMDFHFAGGLKGILEPVVGRVLTAAYSSREIAFEGSVLFTREEAVKVANGLIRFGRIPKGAKIDKNISAAENFGYSLLLLKRGAAKEMDLTANPFAQAIWQFLDGHLGEQDPPIKMETLYKNFMGLNGPQPFGLSRRMVQLFLLALAQQGKIRIGVKASAGLLQPTIDYANIAAIEFSTKVLEGLADISKMTPPENWEVLRSYAEKLIGEAIPATFDDGVISAYRAKLRELFTVERDRSVRTLERARALFEFLGKPNPYARELDQFSGLFNADLDTGDDIGRILFSLQETFGYKAFDSEQADPTEVQDLAVRLANYRNVQRFLELEPELRLGMQFARYPLPEDSSLRNLRAEQKEVGKKLSNLQRFIDSDALAKTELIGPVQSAEGTTGTIRSLLNNYRLAYLALHDQITTEVEECRMSIDSPLHKQQIDALRTMEEIGALRGSLATELEAKQKELLQRLFHCPGSSRASVETQLKQGPEHECGLTFDRAQEVTAQAKDAAAEAEKAFLTAIHAKMEVFFNPAVHERLQQGTDEPVVAQLLACPDAPSVWEFLWAEVMTNPAIVETINRYLKKIQVKRVRLADFRPSRRTWEREQLPDLTREFQQFLEERMGEGDSDELPMVEVE